ncbi:MAG TPA: xanthine dehydrogenase family protein subunit M [Actinomycetes bacterium]
MTLAGLDYLSPTSISEALEMVSRNQGATFLAGGHALLPDSILPESHRRHPRPSTLIDLGRIAELRGIEVLEDAGPPHGGDSGGAGRLVRIGAMTTTTDIEYSPDITRTAPLLSKAAAVISDPLIRNRATLGGSLAEADPHGDWPPLVLATDATMHLRSRAGQRDVPASDFFTRDRTGPGTGSTTLRPGELLTAVTVPLFGDRTRFTYLKRMHPASGHAMLGVAVAVTVDADQTCRDCRIAITGAGAVATRAVRAESQLVGSDLTPEAIERAANAANDGIQFIGDAFGSAAYLAELLPIYVNRALSQLATPSPRP